MAKIGIIGAGQVGASCAFALSLCGVARELALIDLDARKAEGEALDVAHGVPLLAAVDVSGGGYEALDGSDVVIVTAGVNQRPGQSRSDLLENNVAVVRDACRQICRRAPRSVVVMVSNPVDALTRVAQEETGFAAGRVFGSGTLLDSMRLRYMLGAHTGVDARSIHAYVLGEHGQSEVPAWSAVRIGGMCAQEYCRVCGGCDLHLERRLHAAFDEQVRFAADAVIARKGATHFAVSVTVSRIVEAIVRDENSILSVSTCLEGEYGIEEVCLSLPCVVGREGVKRRLAPALSAKELEALRASAQKVQAMQSRAGFVRA